MNNDQKAFLRQIFAKQITAAAEVKDSGIQAAFATVPREHFLGDGPWQVIRSETKYTETPDADLAYLYTDDRFAIDSVRKINNGQPSLHARLISASSIKNGDHIVHIGAGIGYFSSIMSLLTSENGLVTAIEYEEDLAKRAQSNCSAYKNINVQQGDGTDIPFNDADVIYVNAGTTKPADIWLDRLKEGGRLLLPLTTEDSFWHKDKQTMHRRGAVFLITKQGDKFQASWVCPVALYPCQSMRDDISAKALSKAFKKGTGEDVTRLVRSDDIADDQCWLKSEDWCLA